MEVEDQGEASILPLRLFLLGFVLMFAGIAVLIVASLLRGDATVSGAAIIFVGPIPIMIGVGPHAFFAILVAAVLTVIALVLFVWMRKQVSSKN